MPQTHQQRKKNRVEVKVWLSRQAFDELRELCSSTKQDAKTVLESLIHGAQARLQRTAIDVAGNETSSKAARVLAAGARREAVVVATGERVADGKVRGAR